MMFVTPKHEQDKIDMELVESIFARTGIIIHVRHNPGYQGGAILSLVVDYKKGWFEGYDWVVRVNPDGFADKTSVRQAISYLVPMRASFCEWHVL